jgi:hypothetical protein
MIRKASHVGAVLVAALGALAALLVTAPSAGAAPTPHICESFGSFCVGSANLDLFTAVTERNPGRDFTLIPLGTNFDGFPTFDIVFSADPSKCVAAANNLSDVVIHPCNGGEGVVWARNHQTNGHDRWINRRATEAACSSVTTCAEQELSGRDNGTQFILRAEGTAGLFQQFDRV